MKESMDFVKSTDLVVVTLPVAGHEHHPTLKVLFGNVDNNNTMHHGLEILYHISAQIEREALLIEAVQNLIKKNEFLQLNYRLADNQITEDEFEEELEANTDMYLIEMKELDDHKKLFVISSLLNRINRKFNTHEVSELFAIDLNSLNYSLKKLFN